MIANFTFSSFPRIYFGKGNFLNIGKLTANFGNRVLLLTGGHSLIKSGIFDKTIKILKNEGLTTYHEKIMQEPSPSIIDEITKVYRTKNIDIVVAIGGGSVMDSGKAISAMLPVDGCIKNYLEGVGNKKPTGTKIPFIAVPTTSGTGSEATKNAVITEIGQNGFKKSLRHDNYIPNLAIVDPELTLHCPPEITAASGMDAFTQLLESYLSTKCDEISSNMALHALSAIKRSLVKSFENGLDIVARTDVSYAAMVSGITLANAGLGAIHGFASSLGGLYNIPHGVICGRLMATVNRYNINKLRELNQKEYLDRYRQVAALFLDKKPEDDNLLDSFVQTLFSITDKLRIPALGSFNINKHDFELIGASTENKNNPIELSSKEMVNILEDSL